MKKLIVLATLAALPAVAMADVTISGSIGVNLQNIKEGSKASTNDMASQEGDILFKGSEALGNGLKAVWQVNQLFDTTENNGKVTKGHTFVGLQGGFGEIRFGSVNNAPRAIGAVGLADLPTVFGVHGTAPSTFDDLIPVYKSSRQRETDGITFIAAPFIDGLTLAVSHGLKTENRPAVTEKDTVNETTGVVTRREASGKTYETAIGVKYVLNDMLTLAYASNSSKKTTSSKTGLQQEVNAALTFGDVGVNLGHAWNKTDADKKQRGTALSGSYALGATTLIAGFYKQSDSKTAGVKAEDGYKNYSVGVNYDLSKRTYVGVEWAKEDRRGSDKDVRGIATYLWHKF